ncbi:hypothetical protein AZF04_02935 [Alkalihalobacillus trypoxylicola]|uniref:Uncharacterized protein n=1 Tax=Alkalihalobacillus trypoxylicola TaxID=519424 RepID=A0A161QBK3_9BACI|nr:hypothetical protein AZF04_02935 [Alkalihalobacillus trypoxylicola]
MITKKNRNIKQNIANAVPKACSINIMNIQQNKIIFIKCNKRDSDLIKGSFNTFTIIKSKVITNIFINIKNIVFCTSIGNRKLNNIQRIEAIIIQINVIFLIISIFY